MKIKVPFTKLRHAVHISDVHIRLFRRHEEYEQVFTNLYADIRKKQLKDFVIVLVGDIVHAKTDMSPEMVEVTSRFLSNMADIAPTILIAGNHDCNLANTNRLDSLTPIVNNLKHPNLHYIRESTLVEVADVTFSVCSIFDEQEKWPSTNEINDSSTTKIALYHGPVHGATTDANFTITNRHVHVNTFDGYDIVMLGDIHKHQVLKEKNPIMVYSSSPIQQNHGESLDGHGWCLWDIPNKTFEFVPVQNDYGYVTLEVYNSHIIYPANMPKNVRMRLFTGDLEQTKVQKLIASLRNKYNITELSVNKSRSTKNVNKQNNVEHDIVDLQQISTQNALISDWLTRNYPGLDPEVLSAVERVNKDMNSKIVHDDQSRNIHWRPLNFKFSNMFSYGENNEIDFTDMKGIYGIFAPNASGKSSVMDAIMFCLYDKTPRAFKGDHIINNRKDIFECELLFEINHEVFGIRRVGTRKKNGDVKVDVSFWKVLDNGDTLNLNGEDRRDTNANIRSYVGTYEDFVMTALSSQNSNALFIDKSHTERKDLLIQFMGLNIFDKLFDAAHDESREIAGVLKRFKKADVTTELTQTVTEITQHEKILSDVGKELDILREQRDNLDKEFTEIQSQKLPVPDITVSRDILQAQFERTTENIKDYEITVHSLDIQIQSLENENVEYVTSMNSIDVPKLEKSVKRYAELVDVYRKTQQASRIATTKLEEKLKFERQLKEYKYNPDCKVCVSNNTKVISDLEVVTTELQTLQTKIVQHEQELLTLELEMEPVKQDCNQYDVYKQIETQSKKLEGQINKLLSDREKTLRVLERAHSQLLETQRQLELYTVNEENILHNTKIDKILQTIQSNINVNKDDTKSVELRLRDLHGKVSVLTSKKENLQKQLREAEALETTHEAFNHYMFAVGRDGIPYELMSKAIPNIEAEINNILSQIVDFTISLEVDGKNINGKLTYDYDRIWPLENSSGMERFVSSLAIRVALLNASNLPKPNFLIIDEGFGVLDAEHMQTMQTLFGVIKTHFDFMMIVSHLDVMRDAVDHIMEIKKEDGYSSISI